MSEGKKTAREIIEGYDGKQVRYYHPKDIRPEFYEYLTREIKKSLEPQLVTENGKKVTIQTVGSDKDGNVPIKPEIKEISL